MTEETIAIKAVTETAKLVENSLKEVWSLLDAASEKQLPSQFLSQEAVDAIQGNIGPNPS